MSEKKQKPPIKPDTVRASEPRRTTKGPEPEMFKINGYANWEDAVTVAMKKKKPAGGWPK